LRVHDIKEAIEVVKLWSILNGWKICLLFFALY
jgi:hypothetical protein